MHLSKSIFQTRSSTLSFPGHTILISKIKENFMEKLMEISHVGYSYHTMQGETPALSNINFTVHKGDFLAVVGPSGCGNAMVLLRKPSFPSSIFSAILLPFYHILSLYLCFSLYCFLRLMLLTFALGSYFPQCWQYVLWQASLPFLHSPNAI